ncbi:hypothetical protein C6A85_96370 [Mycobacterium sp. ITM-2017-0098]|nr:hypothetical protein C6A85_96370 [Mycobacterium sp. ITM-2017-0098]
MRTAHSAVELVAIPSPFELYPQVFVNALKNAGMLAEMYFAHPFPITQAIIANQAAALSDAATALANGDGNAAFSAVIGAITQPFGIRDAALTYFNETFTQPGQELFYPVVALAPLVNGIVAVGVALRDVIEAVVTFDLIGLVNAIVNIPARIVDGVLNGGYVEYSPGLLTPGDPAFAVPGPIAALIDFDQGTADAIPPWSSTTPDTSGASSESEANALPVNSEQSATDDEEALSPVADLQMAGLEIEENAVDDLADIAVTTDKSVHTDEELDADVEEAAANHLAGDTHDKDRVNQPGEGDGTAGRNTARNNTPADQVGSRQSNGVEGNAGESATSEPEN